MAPRKAIKLSSIGRIVSAVMVRSLSSSKIVDADDRAGQRVFDWNEQSISGAVRNGAEHRVECGPWHGGDFFPEKLHGSGFTERAGFTLKRDPHPPRI